MREAQGKIIGTSSIGEDITERKLAEDARNESEAKFSSAFQSSPVALAILALDGKFVDTNKSFCKLVGYSREEIIGKNIIDLGLISAEDRAKLVAAIESAKGSATSAEVTFYIRDGSVRYILYSTSTISLQGIPHRLSTGIDITERKQAEKEIIFRNKLLSQMGNLAKVGAWEIDVLTMKQEWSDEAYKIHDADKKIYDPNVNKEISRFVEKDAPIIAKAVEDAITNGKPYDLELEMITVKGNHKIVHTIADVEIENGRTTKVYGAVWDITDRKRAEEALRLSEERFSKAFYVSPAGLTITRITDGKFIDVNDSFLRMFEFTREEAIGHTSIELNILSL
ncbi:MAG: PAS domain S-box protein, partial [Chloroflexi bacterium]|nr:PAS domain S-box protein [Chloroflexota bacterium]